jgi:hypothetical protein
LSNNRLPTPPALPPAPHPQPSRPFSSSTKSASTDAPPWPTRSAPSGCSENLVQSDTAAFQGSNPAPLSDELWTVQSRVIKCEGSGPPATCRWFGQVCNFDLARAADFARQQTTCRGLTFVNHLGEYNTKKGANGEGVYGTHEGDRYEVPHYSKKTAKTVLL